ncbi:hypothetical protein EDD18DRAFT_1113662 [Armillaria luteobubalina]|uniref:Uncharacterized protein n=1 Tax=Armillaria luteobubalina TaxID=153913 RepID=A0AA39P993_9AGAR|nr:hypothetical protein EDD18DRAFT_1113662 [Armillaria luteobubalina]
MSQLRPLRPSNADDGDNDGKLYIGSLPSSNNPTVLGRFLYNLVHLYASSGSTGSFFARRMGSSAMAATYSGKDVGWRQTRDATTDLTRVQSNSGDIRQKGSRVMTWRLGLVDDGGKWRRDTSSMGGGGKARDGMEGSGFQLSVKRMRVGDEVFITRPWFI